ncbi:MULTISPECIES: ornithine cyclodeaminase family protein [unclassified Microbacterium]|uniref:ornithine cyclodeaminase family protein n=1 Tax=unclassified Microbacterium TaxID=2609290 RepID=UPI000A8A66BE|nr:MULTISPECIES: ornithine cyclodeaminase family protein [unclassified Microbacterium]WCD93310.1 ornithine cyclodeaminase family protein [Microbacterium sp. nov. GSS16]
MSTDSTPGKLPLFLTDADVEALADLPSAIDAIRAAYSAPVDDARNPGRIFADSGREWMRVMPSVPASGRLFGAKSINGSFADGLRVSYLISLFDRDTADLVALVDGNRVTGLRTAATTAVGAAALVPDRPLTVGVIGSGFEAQSHTAALALVARFASVRVFSPTRANREAFAERFSAELGVPVTAVDSAEQAARDADLVLCAARSRDESPTVQADWIGPNTTVISIGSTTPAQRELPADLIARATLVVADGVDEVVHGSGDMRAAAAAGIDVESITASLNDVLRGDREVDVERGIRIYKSTGSGLQDVVVAETLVDLARERGVGTELPVGIVTTRK